MKTLAITTARQRLGYWLKRALAGEDIGIVVEGHIVGLRRVEVISTDYALQEYGVNEQQLERAADYVEREVKSARKRGKLVRFEGKLRPRRGPSVPPEFLAYMFQDRTNAPAGMPALPGPGASRH